jgi:hypothetical protein
VKTGRWCRCGGGADVDVVVVVVVSVPCALEAEGIPRPHRASTHTHVVLFGCVGKKTGEEERSTRAVLLLFCFVSSSHNRGIKKSADKRKGKRGEGRKRVLSCDSFPMRGRRLFCLLHAKEEWGETRPSEREKERENGRRGGFFFDQRPNEEKAGKSRRSPGLLLPNPLLSCATDAASLQLQLLSHGKMLGSLLYTLASFCGSNS